MNTKEQDDRIQAGTEDNAFRVEFGAALADLMGKVRFRGHDEREWIAEQIALELAEEPVICRRLGELLPVHDEQDAGAA